MNQLDHPQWDSDALTMFEKELTPTTKKVRCIKVEMSSIDKWNMPPIMIAMQLHWLIETQTTVGY